MLQKIYRIFYRYRRYLKKIKKNLYLSKRQIFILITIIQTIGLLLTQLVSIETRYPFVLSLSILAYTLTAFALKDDLSGIEWFTLLTLPTLFTMSVSLFYFLLPSRWITRIPVLFLYSIGMYALLLTENIFNVAVLRTIALLRAAHTVGFLITLVTYYFLMYMLLTLQLNPFFTAFIAGIITYFLLLQSLWSVELTPYLSIGVQYMSAVVALVVVELVWIFSFIPIEKSLLSLFFTTSVYSCGGIGQQFLSQKLYRKTLSEFFIVLMIVMMIMLASTKWRGFV